LRVLYVNHTGIRGGGEESLLELLSVLPDEVSPVVACPDGELTENCREQGIPVETIPAFEASLRLHPARTPRGLLQILRAALAVRRAVRAHRADIVHANSIRAGLIATAAAIGGGPPVIVHVRDCLPNSRPANATRRVIRRGAARVVAISRYTAANFASDDRPDEVEVIYDSIDLKRFDPRRAERIPARKRMNIPRDVTVLAVVGQVTPWKGQDTAIEALGRLGQRVSAVRLLIVGSVKFAGDATRYDNASYLRSLQRMVVDLDLEKEVVFVGERLDMPEVLSAIDILLAPSWEEPFGRAVVEAMAMETPVIATSVGGPSEVIEDGVSGSLVQPRDTAAWGKSIEELLIDPELRAKMGESARRRALDFAPEAHIEHILAAYRSVAAR
jgi:L-malate glycosyltransferase